MRLPEGSRCVLFSATTYWSYPMRYVDDSAVASFEAAGVPEIEIEITPEMIEAGVSALASSNEDFESKEEIITNIYLSMACSRHSER